MARGELVELMADKVLPVEMPVSAVYYSDRAGEYTSGLLSNFLSEHVKTAPEAVERGLIPFGARVFRANQAVRAMPCGNGLILGIQL